MNLAPNQRTLVIFLLGLLSAVAPFSIDMYLPGFPAIAHDLHTSVDAVSYSLASFFVGVCLGQLICGPLLDRFGRKTPLMLGLALYIFASVICALSTSIEALIAGRLAQAFGGCVSMVAPRAIVRDLFPLNENAKVLSLLILVLGISPVLAPTVGSYVIATVGWSYVFIVLAGVGLLIMLAVFIWLPESKPADCSFSLKAGPIMRSYWGVLKTPQFYTYAIAGGISSAGLFAYLSGSPFVFMRYFGVSEQAYGTIFAIIAVGLISSSQLNNLLLKNYTSAQLMQYVLFIQTLMGIALVVGTYFDVLGLYGTVALIFFFLSCQGFCFPNSGALSMAPFTREAGSASALMGALQMGLGALAAAIVGLLNAKSPFPMAIVMFSCTLIGFIMLQIGRRRITDK